MKILTTILLVIMIVFLGNPIGAPKITTSTYTKECCGNTKEKQQPNKDCNPFSNCYYRTFEVAKFIIIKRPILIERETMYRMFECSEVEGFSDSCWHPPNIESLT